MCGFDGNTSAISAIKDGTLGMDIAQLGYDMGYKAVEAAVKALEGEQVDSFIDSGSKVVDSTNCDEYIDDMKAKVLCAVSVLCLQSGYQQKVSTGCGYFCGCTSYYKKESAGRLIPFYNMMCSRKSIHSLWILFVDIRFASKEPKQRTGP